MQNQLSKSNVFNHTQHKNIQCATCGCGVCIHGITCDILRMCEVSVIV